MILKGKKIYARCMQQGLESSLVGKSKLRKMKFMLELRHIIANDIFLTYFKRKGVKTLAEQNNNDKTRCDDASRTKWSKDW